MRQTFVKSGEISTLDSRFIRLTSRQPNAWVAPLQFDGSEDYTGDGVSDLIVGSDSNIEGAYSRELFSS